MKNHFLRKLQLIFAFSMAVQIMAFSCTCSYSIPYFCHAIHETDHVISAVVLGFPDDPDNPIPDLIRYMDVKVLGNLRHEITPSQIVIEGHNGLNCGVDVEQFEIGDSLILALSGQNSSDSIQYWNLTWCPGPHWLSLNNNICTGPYVGGVDTISIDSLKYHLEQGICPESQIIDSTNDQQTLASDNIQVFPNPAHNFLNISLDGSSLASFAIRIYNTNGQEVLISNSNNGNTIQLDVSELPNGIYMIEILQNGEVGYEKFVKAYH